MSRKAKGIDKVNGKRTPERLMEMALELARANGYGDIDSFFFQERNLAKPDAIVGADGRPVPSHRAGALIIAMKPVEFEKPKDLARIKRIHDALNRRGRVEDKTPSPIIISPAQAPVLKQ